MKEILRIAHLDVEVRRSSRRKDVDLSVDRDGGVVIAVPEGMSLEGIEKVIRGKLVWLYATLGRKEATKKREPEKVFLSGEGFLYLGRKYRLQLCPPGNMATAANPLVFANGRFYLHGGAGVDCRELFVKWYMREALSWIAPKVTTLRLRVDAEPIGVEIRDLGYRWGSCTRGGKVYFHWRTILLPPERLEFLILHELVHLHEHNHSAAFYRRLERACPNYKRHEAWFLNHGDAYAL